MKKSVEENETVLKPGYVADFVSGIPVRATPEEVQATQVFSRRLVEDYGYPKSNLQTRPQHRVRSTPSGSGDSYPVDIAVFAGDSRHEQNLFMVVECKKADVEEGMEQLRIYLGMSSAEIGVWFNGKDHRYLRKVHQKGATVKLVDMPDIPKFGQRVQDIGLHLRRDLRKPKNLRLTFHILRNHLAGNAVGTTRDETLAQQIINLLFCKIYDELNTAPDEMVSFRAVIDETPADVQVRITALFDKVRKEYTDVFDKTDAIGLDAVSLMHVVGELQSWCVTEADRDAVGDAFEVFIGPALRGPEGQFFTPRNVVQMLIDMVDPQPGEMIIDPACGSGGFLIGALNHVWARLDAQGVKMRWGKVRTEVKKRDIASQCFRGLDKDSFLAKVTKAYMAIMGDGRGGVFCENSLERPQEWRAATREKIGLDGFDVVVTNPPFGKKIKIKGAPLLAQYGLAHKWQLPRKKGAIPIKTSVVEKDRPPQLVFIERCLQLLRDGGRLGIVIPESILGSPSYAHVVHFLMSKATIKAVVTMPESLFKTSGKGGTHTKVCVVVLEKTEARGPYNIFMANVKWCGHDSRGNPTIRKNDKGEMVLLDEVPTVALRYQGRDLIDPAKQDRLGFVISSASLRHNILVPKYYDPGIQKHLDAMRGSHDLMSVGTMVSKRLLSMTNGVEVGKMAYGTGEIPFVRTSDLSNWEIKLDYKHGVSQEIFEEHTANADVIPGDILLVKDGTYLIGTTAIVSASDVPMLFQSHIYRIRALDPDKLSPWLLFACLNSPIVKRQIRSVQFTQDIIDSIGQRLREVVVPFPRDAELRARLIKETQHIIETRSALRDRAKKVALDCEGTVELGEEDLEAVQSL